MAMLIGGDLRTGEIKVRAIPAASGSLSMPLNKPESLSLATRALPWMDAETGTTIDLPSLITPTKSFLGWDEGGVLLGGGPIWTEEDDFDAAATTYQASGIESIFDWRLVLQVLIAGQKPRDVTTTWTTSMRTQAKRLAELALANVGGDLPIVMEDDIPGDIVLTYKGSDLVKVSQAINNIRATDGGPDISFQMRYQTDRRFVEWAMKTGDPLIQQDGADHVWDHSVPGSSITGMHRILDGSSISTDDFENGGTVNVQTVSIAGTPTGGTFTLAFDGQTTAAIAFNASTAIVQAALEALSNVDPGDVTVEGAAGAWAVIFGGQYSGQSAPQMTPTGSVTGGTVAVDTASRVQEAMASDRTLTDAGFPRIETANSRNSETDETVLASYAQGVVANGRDIQTSLSFSVAKTPMIDGVKSAPWIGTYWPGDWCQIVLGQNPFVTKGRYRHRIVQIDVTLSDQVTVTCAPERDVIAYPVVVDDLNFFRDQIRRLNDQVDEAVRGR